MRAALGAGADGIEVDGRLTIDLVWVCHHNLRNGPAPVAATRLAELHRRGIDTLDTVLASVPDSRWLFVELKPLSGRRLAAGMRALEELLAGRPRTRILSSSTRLLATASSFLPDATPSLVVRSGAPPLPAGWTLSPHHTLVEALLATGRELHPWTVNHPKRQLRLAQLGVASLTTDDPERALRALCR